jgi:predicted RNase H-like nuclease
MGRFVGIDGFRYGWVAASIDDRGGQRFDYAGSLERLFREPYERAMVDMPIGLPTTGRRRCDSEARNLVGPSVFTGIRRTLLDFDHQSDANAYYRSTGEPGVSAQLSGIVSKVREVDELKASIAATSLHETHPELVFQRLNGGRVLDRKKSRDGREQRVALLVGAGFGKIRRWLEQRHGTGIGRDDLIDSCACAIAARDATEWLPKLDEPPDPRGLAMRIWY